MKKAKILTPLLMIFNDDGSIDYDGNKRLINHLLDNGVDGIVPLGSTGEFTSICVEQRKAFIKFCLDLVGERGIVLPGTACPQVEKTIELSNYALENGAAGVLIICQYYYEMSDKEIIHYYDYIAPQVNGNLYLYNFPARTSTSFTPQMVLELVRKHNNIVGMKESVPSFAHTRDIMNVVLKEFPDFMIYSGFDDQFNDNVDFGGAGSIGALANLFPQLWAKLIVAKNSGDSKTTLEIKNQLMKLMPLYTIETNCPGLFKHILKARGLDINTTTHFPFENVPQTAIDKALTLIEETL